MQMSRGPLYYLGVLAWGIFPWSFLLPVALRRRKPSSVFLGWLVFGLAFWSLLVMKREVYLVTVLPAVAALVGERLGEPGGAADRPWRRLSWLIAAVIACAGLAVFARAFARLAELADSRSAAAFFGLALAALAAALVAAAVAPESARSPFAVVLGCGLVLAAVQNLDLKLGRWDPLPEWGRKARAECAGGCDGFLYGNNFNSVDFYSGFDWIMVGDPARLAEELRHARGFVVMWTSLEPNLAGLALKAEVVDRRQVFRGSFVATALGTGSEGLDSLSLVRIEKR